jgi:hypothetical protein
LLLADSVSDPLGHPPRWHSPGCSPSSPGSCPSLGTRQLERLEENSAAVDVDATADDLDEIEAAASKITVRGARYPERLERLTGR